MATSCAAQFISRTIIQSKSVYETNTLWSERLQPAEQHRIFCSQIYTTVDYDAYSQSNKKETRTQMDEWLLDASIAETQETLDIGRVTTYRYIREVRSRVVYAMISLADADNNQRGNAWD